MQPTGLVRPSKHVHMVDENGQSLLSGGKLSSKTPFGGKMPGRKALGNITNKQPQGTPLPAKTPAGGASDVMHPAWEQHASAPSAFTSAAGKIQHISRRALGDITNTPAALRPTQQSLKRPPSLQKPATAASTALPRPSQLFTQQEEKLPAASAVQQGAVQQAAPQVDADLQTLAELYAGAPAMILALLNTLTGPACGMQKEPCAEIVLHMAPPFLAASCRLCSIRSYPLYAMLVLIMSQRPPVTGAMALKC